MDQFDVLYERMGTGSIRWDRAKAKFGTDKELLPLWIADTDFRAPEEVVEALRRRADHGIFGYTFAMPEYLESVARWYRRRHGLEARAEWIAPTYGVVTALYFTIRELTRPGDKVMIMTPAYEPFFAIISNLDRQIAELELSYHDNTYTIDFDAMERMFQEGVKLLLFCNPHNPVGRVWKREELEQVARLCAKYGVYLASDEIHGDVALFGNRYISMASFEQVRELVAVYTSAGKGFSMTGLHTSNMIIPDPKLRDRIAETLRGAWIMSPNLFGLEATRVAYEQCEYWLDEEIAYLEGNSRFVTDFLAKELPEVTAAEHEATYLMWLDFHRLGLSDEELVRRMTEVCRLGLGVGSHYGAQFGQFLRLNIGCPRQLLEKAMKALCAIR